MPDTLQSNVERVEYAHSVFNINLTLSESETDKTFGTFGCKSTKKYCCKNSIKFVPNTMLRRRGDIEFRISSLQLAQCRQTLDYGK